MTSSQASARTGEIWLDAHRITELVVLCAQHLGEGPERELRELGQRTSIAITLVYSGHEAAVHEATITLGNLISRSRWPPGPDPKFEPWPAVPPSCSRCGARIYVRV